MSDQTLTLTLSTLTADELAAMAAANSPSETNAFATMDDIPSVAAESDPVFTQWLSDTPPAYPADIPDVAGLLNETSHDLLDHAGLTGIPTALPASDVYSWAKAATKPTYTASEVGAQPLIKTQYTAFVTQTSTGAPSEVIVKDSITGLTWARTTTGTYTLTKTGAFTANKTIPVSDVYYDAAGNKLTMERTSADVMTLKTYAAADTETLADGVLSSQFVNIEVYS